MTLRRGMDPVAKGLATRPTRLKAASGPCRIPPDVRGWPTKRARLARPSVGARTARASSSLAAGKLVQSIGEQRQRNDCADGDETRSGSLNESPERVCEDSHGETPGALRFVNRAGWARSRVSEPGEKRVRIALGQQLARSLGHLRTNQDELGMHLPRLDVTVLLRQGLVQRRSRATRGA
jgi:hypothetical protein